MAKIDKNETIAAAVETASERFGASPDVAGSIMSAVTPLSVHEPRGPRPAQTADARLTESVDRASASDAFQALDRMAHAVIAKWTMGLSPAALAGAYFDWGLHLALSPGKQLELARRAILEASAALEFAWRAAEGQKLDPCEPALPHDDRFRAPAWQDAPFNIFARNFLSIERWWEAATTNLRGVSQHHDTMANIVARQILDPVAPSNFLLTNPEVLERTRAEWGANLVRGWNNWIADCRRARAGAPPRGLDAFEVGRNVAVTPGKVVLRTRLAEVIQYAPAAERVRPEPIVIVPAWIMKYYILDLSPGNSLVKFLTEQGFTVFMISWKNPGPEDRDIDFDEYRTEGVMPAIAAAAAITGAAQVHATGYCLGGMLMAITAATMARDGDDRLKSLSLFAAETDFSKPGELSLFIDESQLTFLEDMMWERGYLDSTQMAGAFQMLRSIDLIWSRNVHDYLMGDQAAPIDIMAWNADATRMPYRMHSQYLRSLYLKNELAEGRFKVDGRPVALQDIRVPTFVVATERDHVAPWRSVYKLHLLAGAEITFALTNGGHNAGIVSEPGHRGRHFRVGASARGDLYVDPDAWLAAHAPQTGSWWPEWTAWLAARSDALTQPPALGNAQAGFPALEDAPGHYVLVK
ncbi:MAG TPA: alpha/beta fold hydrolase [Roseiarcus sp.]|nr:alpha/beta fold hydrolase [Roseiarcus sp.]